MAGQTLKWSDADEIGYELNLANPDTDPLSVRFTDLHKMVLSLPAFKDAPDASNEAKLEAIQMAWLGYFQEKHGAG